MPKMAYLTSAGTGYEGCKCVFWMLQMLVNTILNAKKPKWWIFWAEAGIWFAYIVLIVSTDEVYEKIAGYDCNVSYELAKD